MTRTPSDGPAPGSGGDRAFAVLRVGHVPGVTVRRWQRVWAERFPRLALELSEVAESDQRAALDEGRVDLCFVRLPVDGAALHVIPLYEEVPVVVVPRDHPVSLYDEVSLADLADETLLDPVDGVDPFDLVAGGAGVLLAPHSVARSRSRRDLVFRPVSDGTPTRVGLAWLAENPQELIEEFIGIVRGRTANSSRSSGRGTSTPVAPAAADRRGRAAKPSPATSKARTTRNARRPGRGGGR